jgi:hypothetical protein
MKNLRDRINDVLKEHPEIEFRFCRPGRYEAVLDGIAERFLTRGRYDLDQTWWWACLANQTESSVPADVFAELRKRLHPEESYWFVASEEDGKYWVAEASGAAIPEVLGEMPPFEYYIIDRKMTWLLCENHHDTLIEARARFWGARVPIA